MNVFFVVLKKENILFKRYAFMDQTVIGAWGYFARVLTSLNMKIVRLLKMTNGWDCSP